MSKTNPPIYEVPQPLPEDKPSKRTKVINKGIVFALLIIALAIGLILSWGLQSEDVLTLHKNPFPTRTIRQHPTAGGVVFLTADYCKNRSVHGTFRASFVSASREVFLPITKELTPKGCGNMEFPILIPKDIQPDTYRIKIRLIYNINPLKQGIIQEYYSTPVVIDPITATNGLSESATNNLLAQ